MATKKTAKKAQSKASPTKTPAPKPSSKAKPASKESRTSAPAAKNAAKAKAPPTKKNAPVPVASASSRKESKAKVKSVDAKKETKASSATKPAAKKTTKANSKVKAPPAKAPRSGTESEVDASTSSARVDVGDSAPSFVLKDDSGTVISSESLRGNPYVLYFYPKDDTPGCTLEACGFRDSLPRFNAKGVRVIGVSPDSPEAHTRFKKKYELSFTLLSDPEKMLANAYGVWVKKQNYGREYMGVERSTFVVDKNGTVEQVWRGVRVPGHVDAVLDSV